MLFQTLLLTAGDGLQGLAGLENAGNTCFASSVIQCLAAVPDVVAHVERLHREQDPAAAKPLTASFAQLLRSMRTAQGQPCSTCRSVSCLAVGIPTWKVCTLACL